VLIFGDEETKYLREQKKIKARVRRRINVWEWE
jgi:hypothetical protein